MGELTGLLRNAALSFLSSSAFGKSYDEDLKLPAIVFAPHPDDETLGCGGTIALKRSQGVPVTVVFFTDGRGSHPGLIAGDDLAAIRKDEAIQACKALGVPETHLVFMGIEDGSLFSHAEEVKARCLDLLNTSDARQVFIPCSKENHPDHLAANVIMRQALRASTKSFLVYEYAIYLHRNWPWCRHTLGRLSAMTGGITATARFLFQFRCWVSTADVLQMKIKALEEHRTQMTRYVDDSSWRTLGSVSDGDFLSWFCRDQEFFRRTTTRGSTA